VFNKVVAVALKYVLPLLNSHLDIADIQGNKKSPIPMNHKKWQGTVRPLAKSYITSILELIEANAHQKNALLFIKYLPHGFEYYATCFPKLCRKYLKLILAIWANTRPSTTLTSNEVNELRVLSFLHVRRFGQINSSCMDMAMRGIYLAYIRTSKFTSVHTLPALQFLCQCVVELYGQDMEASYQHAFVYIRQLAGHLRNAMNIKSKESYQAVYTWQVIHSIDLWCRFLATFCTPEKSIMSGNLPSLIYPLVQVIFGVTR
jgi:nucleolar complex protein 2